MFVSAFKKFACTATVYYTVYNIYSILYSI